VANVTIPAGAPEGACEPAVRRDTAPFRIYVSANSRLRLESIRLVGEGPMDGQQFHDMLFKLPALDDQRSQNGAREAYESKGLWIDSQSIKYVDKFGEKVFEEPVSAVKSTARMTGSCKMNVPGSKPIDVPTYWLRITFSDGKIYNFDGANASETLKKRLGK